jgi:uroporphyrinogen decarboxylase
VRRVVRRNLTIAGPAGGLLCTPTHMLEPDVPWENIMAYVEAVRDAAQGD